MLQLPNVRWAGRRWKWTSPALLLVSAVFVVRTAPPTAGTSTSKPPREITAGLLRPKPEYSRRIGSLVPFKNLYDFSFATARVGYALAAPGQLPAATYPAVTTDGGRIWRIDGPPLHIPAAQAPAAVRLIGTGSEATAFAYQGGQAIDATNDAGRQWWGTYFDNELAAAASGSSISTLVNGLSPEAVWLYTSTDGGRHWFYKSTLPNLAGISAELVRLTPMTAFALVQSSYGKDPQAAGIVETTDGGTRWIRRSDPCTSTTFADTRVDWTEQLQASSTTSLWLFCGNQPGTGTQVKLVERSSDSGMTWRTVASIGPGEHHPPNDIPFAGALANTGTTGSLVVTTSSDAWLILTDVLWRTSDCGRSWFAAAPASMENQFPQQLSLARGHLFVKTQNALWSSVAGKRWTLVSGSNKPY